MKRFLFFISLILIFFMEIILLIHFALQIPDFSQDTVAVNEIMQSVTKDFNQMENHTKANRLDYVVLDKDDNVLYITKLGLSENLNIAIAHRDTILNIVIDNEVVGKVIIDNNGAKTLQSHKQIIIIILLVSIFIQCGIYIGYVIYMYFTMIKPFR